MTEPMTDELVAERYASREATFGAEAEALTARWNRVANLRLLAAIAALGLLGWGLYRGGWPLLALAGAAFLLFAWLVVVHRRLGRERNRAAALHEINREGIARLARDWDGLPLSPVTGAPPDHPFANDLDLFGRASLFQLLDTLSTPMGAERLRGWLLEPAHPSVIGQRQPAVHELAPELAWRQELEARGRVGGTDRPNPEPFLQWAEGPSLLAAKPWAAWLARLGTLGLVVTAGLQLAGVTNLPLWIAFAIFNVLLVTLVGGAWGQIEAASDHQGAIGAYGEMLEHLDRATFTSPLLQVVSSSLSSSGRPASEQVNRLRRRTALVIPRGSLLYLPVQALAAWDIQVLSTLEAWKRESGGDVRAWLAAIGEIEALAALGGLAGDNPGWAWPTLAEGEPAVSGDRVGHPLIAPGQRVCNDVTVGPRETVLLVTGSNMSGKSTLLRSIGVNAVLAGAGAPTCATRFSLPPVELWTSARISDSLEAGVSFYMAELLRLKQVVDAANAAPERRPVLYLLDEILQGTNTVERHIAASHIISSLVQAGAIGAVSTHDLALASAPELVDAALPVHFQEQVTDGVMTFDYQLRPGIATSTNALKLMEIVGFDMAGARTNA